MSRKSPYTAEMKANAIKAYSEGKSASDVANEFKVPYSTLQVWIKPKKEVKAKIKYKKKDTVRLNTVSTDVKKDYKLEYEALSSHLKKVDENFADLSRYMMQMKDDSETLRKAFLILLKLDRKDE